MPGAIGPAPTAIPYGGEEDRLRRLAATIPGMLYDYVLNPDSSSKFLYVGPKCHEILELNEQELLSDAGLFWELVVEEDLQRLKSEDVAANLEGESFSAEVRIRTRSGSLKWIQLSSRPNPAPPGELVVWSGFMLDITERKKAEKKLAFHSDILQSLSEGINIVRVSDGIVVFANPQFERMFGYGSGELVGKHISIVNAPDERSAEAVAKEITSALEKSGAWTGEVKNIRKNGNVFWCQAGITTLDHDEFGPVWVSTQH
jgi:PAS domain S-box-containing protein